jgi:hypothetical protein
MKNTDVRTIYQADGWYERSKMKKISVLSEILWTTVEFVDKNLNSKCLIYTEQSPRFFFIKLNIHYRSITNVLVSMFGRRLTLEWSSSFARNVGSFSELDNSITCQKILYSYVSKLKFWEMKLHRMAIVTLTLRCMKYSTISWRYKNRIELKTERAPLPSYLMSLPFLQILLLGYFVSLSLPHTYY